MKKLISAIMVLVMCTCLMTAFYIDASAVGEVALIYKTDDSIVIDGELDAGYTLISYSYSTGDGNWCENEDLLESIDSNVEFYACWDDTNIYLYVKAPCNEEHKSYMDDTETHYIFNGHHCMWALLPDNPYQEKYKYDSETYNQQNPDSPLSPEGSWPWGEIYSVQFMYEWTTICDSRDGSTVYTDHFRDLTTKSTFQCTCLADGEYDTYEVAIPMADVVTSDNPGGIAPEEGSMFGLGFRVGLMDSGLGYSGETPELEVAYDQKVSYSDYFIGDKYPYGLTYVKLAAKEASTEPKKVESKYEIFPSLAGEWQYTDHNGTRCNVTMTGDKAAISGSVDGSWPSAYVDLTAPLLVDSEDAYLVYDFSFTSGQFSLRFNEDDALGKLISENIDAGSGDLNPGEYKGAIPFSAIAEEYGTDADGYYRIDNVTVFSVGGAEITVNMLNIVPDYITDDTPSEPDESSEPDTPSEPDEPSEPDTPSEPDEPSEPDASSKPEDSVPVQDGEQGNMTWLWIVIAVVAVAAIAAVIIIVIKKKKQ